MAKSKNWNFTPDRRSECVTVYVQTDLQGVTSATRNTVGLIIILLGLELQLVLGFMVRVAVRFRVTVRVFDGDVMTDGQPY